MATVTIPRKNVEAMNCLSAPSASEAEATVDASRVHLPFGPLLILAIRSGAIDLTGHWHNRIRSGKSGLLLSLGEDDEPQVFLNGLLGTVEFEFLSVSARHGYIVVEIGPPPDWDGYLRVRWDAAALTDRVLHVS